MVFNATFNNISVILWWSVLLMTKTVENHRSAREFDYMCHTIYVITLNLVLSSIFGICISQQGKDIVHGTKCMYIIFLSAVHLKTFTINSFRENYKTWTDVETNYGQVTYIQQF